jgi:hypothetical protein
MAPSILLSSRLTPADNQHIVSASYDNTYKLWGADGSI